MENNSSKNLNGAEGIAMIKELVGHARTCLFMTALDKKPMSVRPMTVQKVDDKGCIYFLSDKNSHMNEELKLSNEMHFTIANDSNSEYLSLYGTAEIYRDQKEIDEMYSQFANNWFEGKEDPNISIIRFAPKEGHYWDTKHGKAAQMIGIVIGAITGKQADDGLEGKIKL